MTASLSSKAAPGFRRRDHLRAAILTALLCCGIGALIFALVPWGCHTRADEMSSRWGCLFPLSLLYVSPTVAVAFAGISLIKARWTRFLSKPWLLTLLISAVAGQLTVLVIILIALGGKPSYVSLDEFLIFPQAPLAGTVAGLAYWMALRVKFSRKAAATHDH